MNCEKCGKAIGGFSGEVAFTVTLEGKITKVCQSCYDKLGAEYSKMKTCNNCFYFNDGFCKKIELELTYTQIGNNYYFVQANDCVHFMTKEEYEKKALRGEAVRKEPERQVREKEIIREKEVIIKVKCPYCGKLYNETFDVCPHCGGKR